MATNIGTLVLLKLEARQREIVTLSGTSGTANITGVGSLTKLATFATDLTTTAKNFVTSHAAAYLAVNVIVTASDGKLCFKSTTLNAGITAPSIANASGNLAGTVSHTVANNGTLNLIGETSTSFKSAQTMVDVSSKASGINSSFKGGRITQTVSVSSIASTDTATTGYGHEDALAAQYQQVPIDFTITEYSAGSQVAGAILFTGTSIVSNVSEEIPDNDKMTFSLDLQVSDSLVVSVV